jgi:lipid A disaccharide synthetase
MSELLRLKGSMAAVAKDAASMAIALGGLRKRLEASAAEADRQVRGTAQQQRYAAMIVAYQQAAKACEDAAAALAKAGRAGTEIGQSL